MAQKQSASKKARFVAYVSGDVAKQNKARRLHRHQRNHPNDTQAANSVASGHTRKAPLGRGVVVVNTGFKITGEKSLKNARTGRAFQVPVFEACFAKTRPGFISNELYRGKVNFSIEARTNVTAFELKAALGL